MESTSRSKTGVRAGLAAIALLLLSCGGGGSDSDHPPTSTRVPINTANGWSDSPFISRDGQRLYFMYSRYDFSVWLKSGGTQLPPVTGPDRPGLHKSNTNAFDESDIYVATKNPDGTWSEPVNLGLNGAFGDSSGMEFNNGNSFIWLRGNGTTNDIVMTHKTNGIWGAPVNLGSGINDHSPGVFQDNPHISADGTGLWFTSNRSGGFGGKDLWFSMFSGGSWSNPVNLAAPFNTPDDEDQFYLNPVGLDIFWNGPSGLMHCISNGTGCSALPTVVTIPGCQFAAEASVTDDGQLLYFACGDLTTFKIKIMYSVKQSNGSWGPATPVD